MTFNFGLKESGGFPIPRWVKPAAIIRGQHCKFGLIVCDANCRALTITNHTITLRLKKQDGSILEIAATHIYNEKGEVEFELLPEHSNSLLVGPKQPVEVEIKLTANQGITSFYPIKEALTVVEKLLT